MAEDQQVGDITPVQNARKCLESPDELKIELELYKKAVLQLEQENADLKSELERNNAAHKSQLQSLQKDIAEINGIKAFAIDQLRERNLFYEKRHFLLQDMIKHLEQESLRYHQDVNGLASELQRDPNERAATPIRDLGESTGEPVPRTISETNKTGEPITDEDSSQHVEPKEDRHRYQNQIQREKSRPQHCKAGNVAETFAGNQHENGDCVQLKHEGARQVQDRRGASPQPLLDDPLDNPIDQNDQRWKIDHLEKLTELQKNENQQIESEEQRVFDQAQNEIAVEAESLKDESPKQEMVECKPEGTGSQRPVGNLSKAQRPVKLQDQCDEVNGVETRNRASLKAKCLDQVVDAKNWGVVAHEQKDQNMVKNGYDEQNVHKKSNQPRLRTKQESKEAGHCEDVGKEDLQLQHEDDDTIVRPFVPDGNEATLSTVAKNVLSEGEKLLLEENRLLRDEIKELKIKHARSKLVRRNLREKSKKVKMENTGLKKKGHRLLKEKKSIQQVHQKVMENVKETICQNRKKEEILEVKIENLKEGSLQIQEKRIALEEMLGFHRRLMDTKSTQCKPIMCDESTMCKPKFSGVQAFLLLSQLLSHIGEQHNQKKLTLSKNQIGLLGLVKGERYPYAHPPYTCIATMDTFASYFDFVMDAEQINRGTKKFLSFNRKSIFDIVHVWFLKGRP